MRKGGQISVFLVVACVLIIAVLGLYLSSRRLALQEPHVPDDAASAVSLVLSGCLRDRAEEGLLEVGEQGGFVKPPEDGVPVVTFWFYPSVQKRFSVAVNARLVPVYVGHGKVHVPQVRDVESALAEYVRVRLPECVNQSVFAQQGYRVSLTGDRVQAKMMGKRIVVQVESPVRVVVGRREAWVQNVGAVLEFEYPARHEIIRKIVEKIALDPGMIPYGFVNHMALMNQFRYEIVVPDNETVLYNLFFPFTKEREYKHSFGVIP